jgi:hypothetical protein
MLMLEILDLKLANADNWNQCDAATQGGLNNNVRLCLRELGLKPPAPKKVDLATYLAGKRGPPDPPPVELPINEDEE